MPVELFEDIEQGSEAWIELRRGRPTASRFKDILAESKDMAMRNKYLRQLAAERYSGQATESYSNAHMDRGKVQEAKIRAAYAFLTGNTPRLVGLVRRGIADWSPDSLIGDEGALEIKSAEPHILFDLIDKGKFPSAHISQCQGGLWVGERFWIDIAIGYFPDSPPKRPYPLFIKRAGRDEKAIAEIAAGVNKFDQEVSAFVRRIEAYVPD